MVLEKPRSFVFLWSSLFDNGPTIQILFLSLFCGDAYNLWMQRNKNDKNKDQDGNMMYITGIIEHGGRNDNSKHNDYDNDDKNYDNDQHA